MHHCRATDKLHERKHYCVRARHLQARHGCERCNPFVQKTSTGDCTCSLQLCAGRSARILALLGRKGTAPGGWQLAARALCGRAHPERSAHGQRVGSEAPQWGAPLPTRGILPRGQDRRTPHTHTLIHLSFVWSKRETNERSKMYNPGGGAARLEST